MDDAQLMRGVEGIGDLMRQRERLVHVQWPGGERVSERRPLDELEHEPRRRTAAAVERLHAIDGGDVRMIECGEDLRFAPETRDAFGICGDVGRQNLDRHLAAQHGVCGAIDFAHPTRAEPRVHAIGAELRSNHDRLIVAQQVGYGIINRLIDQQ
jgi:hypothetical protein